MPAVPRSSTSQSAKERLYAWLNDGAFAEAKGCSHPLDVIAVAIGCTERTVIRCVKQLECEGRVRVDRPKVRGRANTYWVDCWNPRKRSDVLNVLAEGRAEVERRRNLKRERELSRLLRRAECHPKRPAAPCRARTAPASTEPRALLPRCSSLNQRCGRERESFEFRKVRMDQRRRHLHVADLTCIHCTEKDREIEELRKIRQTLQLELNRSMENEAGALAAAKAAGNALIALKGQLTREHKRWGLEVQVAEVVAHWRHHRPKTTEAFGLPGSKSFDIIEKALVLMENDPATPVVACNEAIDGLHLAPWEAYGKRATTRETRKHKLRNDISDCLRDELRIEKFRAIRRWLLGDDADHAWELLQVVEATGMALSLLVLEKLGERRAGEPVEPFEARFTVDGLVTTESGR